MSLLGVPPNRESHVVPQRGDPVVQDGQAGSELPHKGCADLGHRTQELSAGRPVRSQTPPQPAACFLSGGHCSTLKPSGTLLCQRNGSLPLSFYTRLGLGLPLLCHQVNSHNPFPQSGLSLFICKIGMRFEEVPKRKWWLSSLLYA